MTAIIIPENPDWLTDPESARQGDLLLFDDCAEAGGGVYTIGTAAFRDDGHGSPWRPWVTDHGHLLTPRDPDSPGRYAILQRTVTFNAWSVLRLTDPTGAVHVLVVDAEGSLLLANQTVNVEPILLLGAEVLSPGVKGIDD